jgi:hypothetical protein
MTLNYSLQLSEQIRGLMRDELIGQLKTYYPEEKIINFGKKEDSRDRIYNN